jgi:hypothetical protein
MRAISLSKRYGKKEKERGEYKKVKAGLVYKYSYQ